MGYNSWEIQRFPAKMADSTLCGDCGGTQANVQTHHFLAEVGGPLCRRCFAARTKESRPANRAKGLCRCGVPPIEGICSRTGRPWSTCAGCRAKRREGRADQQDRDVIQEGLQRGWRPGMTDLSPHHLEAMMRFMRAIQARRDRRRDRRRRRRSRRADPPTEPTE